MEFIDYVFLILLSLLFIMVYRIYIRVLQIPLTSTPSPPVSWISPTSWMKYVNWKFHDIFPSGKTVMSRGPGEYEGVWTAESPNGVTLINLRYDPTLKKYLVDNGGDLSMVEINGTIATLHGPKGETKQGTVQDDVIQVGEITLRPL